ncbi:MAG: ABC transporter permease [Spirochaetales bacterium]
MGAVYRRELMAYIRTPVGAVYTGLFLLLAGYFFVSGHLLTGSSFYTTYMQNILFLHLLTVPLLTMRLLSEEYGRGTDKLLLSAPVSVSAVVVGKYLAACTVFLVTVLFTLVYAAIVAVYGDLAVGEVVGAYLGYVLLGACFIAVGLFVGGQVESQVNAAFLTFVALLALWLIDGIREIAPSDERSGLLFVLALISLAGVNIYAVTTSARLSAGIAVAAGLVAGLLYLGESSLFTDLISRTLLAISPVDRYPEFRLGIIRLSSLVFYVSFAGVFVFLTIQNMERRRWT